MSTTRTASVYMVCLRIQDVDWKGKAAHAVYGAASQVLSFLGFRQWAREELNLRPHAYQAAQKNAHLYKGGTYTPPKTSRQRGLGKDRSTILSRIRRQGVYSLAFGLLAMTGCRNGEYDPFGAKAALRWRRSCSAGPWCAQSWPARKLQTRRVILPQLQRMELIPPDFAEAPLCWMPNKRREYRHVRPEEFADYCPYGNPGDRLWVRETFSLDQDWDNAVFFKADDSAHRVGYHEHDELRPSNDPRDAEASAGPLAAIDSHAAVGVAHHARDHCRARAATVWNSLNAKRGFGWDVNPVGVGDRVPESRGMTAELTLLDLLVMLLWTAAAAYALGWLRGWSTGVHDEKKRLVRSIMSEDAGE